MMIPVTVRYNLESVATLNLLPESQFVKFPYLEILG